MINTSRRTAFNALALSICLLCAATHARAQAGAPLNAPPSPRTLDARTLSAAKAGQTRHLLPLRAGETTDGSRVFVSSDAPLDDYAAYREGARFLLLIPRAEASAAQEQLRGRGFSDARLEREGAGVLLVFTLTEGTTARVMQKFNRLEVVFGVQGQKASGVANNAPADDSTARAADPATKDAAATRDDAAQLRQMLRRIEELEARIKELEARQERSTTAQTAPAAESSMSAAATLAAHTSLPVAASGERATQTTPTSQTAPAVAAHDHEAPVQRADLPNAPPSLQIKGYADVGFSASNERGKNSSFALGQLDLFITSQLSERFSVLGELILEANERNEFDFEIHRLLLRYQLNDYFNISAGRYHTAIGYYNTAYHHGNWFATAANRPFIFAFEDKGGVLPNHNVGATASGRIPSGSLGLRYVAEIGNGRSARATLDRSVQTAGDENNGKAFNLALVARPEALRGFQTGFSFYRDRRTPASLPAVGENIMAAHVVYKNSRYELLNEALLIRHAVQGANRVFYTPGFYTQFARRFGKASPYFRYQYVNAPDDEPLFPDVKRRNGPTLGLRYDVSDYAALKLQYDRTERRRLSHLDELILQLAFTF